MSLLGISKLSPYHGAGYLDDTQRTINSLRKRLVGRVATGGLAAYGGYKFLNDN